MDLNKNRNKHHYKKKTI